MKNINSRAVAAAILFDVCHSGKSLSDAFEKQLLKIKDVSYIKSLCFGSLRFYPKLIGILNQLLQKPLKPKDKDVECLLILGLYQLLETDTKPYAAINETVSAAKKLKKPWASGLVNKILRMATAPENYNDQQSDVIRYAHPKWLIRKIKAQWPDDWEKILLANNQQAPLFLRINQQRISKNDYCSLLNKEDIAHEIIDTLSSAIQITHPIPVQKLPGFQEGFFSVQDLTGQQVVNYLNLNDDQLILDACCAPGSKTTHMLEVKPNIESIIAIDISESRLQKVSENLERLQLPIKKVTIKSADIADVAKWWDKAYFDRILIDAPCSASGVIRRHPDIKLLRKESDITALAETQLEILTKAWETLAHGGRCVYTTCSIFSEENEQVVKQFLEKHSDAAVKKIENEWGLTLTYGQQVLPGNKDRDGFYYAVLVKQ